MESLERLLVLEKKAIDYGFEWPNAQMIIDQVISECAEVREAIDNREPDFRVQEEIGDLLHAVISLCTFLGFDQGLLMRTPLQFL